MPRMREEIRSGWNASSASVFLADPEELDRLAGDVAHRQRRSAARVTVGLRQHDPGERKRGVERLRGMRRILAGHAVHDEQRLDRRHRGVDPPDLVHHPLVDVEPARGVHEQHVGEAPPRLGEGAGGESRPGRRRARSARTRLRPAPPGYGAGRWRRGGRRRSSPSSPTCPPAPRVGVRASRPSWSCPTPGGRRPEPPPAAVR